MDAMYMTVDEIRCTGKKLGFSYVEALSLYLYEWILYWISRQPLGEQMWLRQWDLFEKEKKKRMPPNQMIYYMKDISYQMLKQTMEELFTHPAWDIFSPKWELLFFDKQIEVVLNIRVETVQIPFKIIIRPIWQQEQFAEQEEYHFLLWEGKDTFYRAYPVELYVAESFYEILDKLELIRDMGVYDTLYQILCSHTVDGRRAYLNLSELFKKQKIMSLEKRWNTILSYQDYSYMKKRWNKQRKLEKEEVSWKECIQVLEKFFHPIWEAFLENRIFLGDWMPNLGRYL